MGKGGRKWRGEGGLVCRFKLIVSQQLLNLEAFILILYVMLHSYLITFWPADCTSLIDSCFVFVFIFLFYLVSSIITCFFLLPFIRRCTNKRRELNQRRSWAPLTTWWNLSMKRHQRRRMTNRQRRNLRAEVKVSFENNNKN